MSLQTILVLALMLVGVILCFVLAWRLVRKVVGWLRSRSQSASAPNLRTAASPAAETVAKKAAAVPEPIAPTVHATAAPSIAATAAPANLYVTRALEAQPHAALHRSRDAGPGHLPRVEPGDIPTADPGDYVFGGATPLLASLLPESDERRTAVKTELRHAGFYQPHALQNMAAVRYVGIMLPLLMLGVLMVIVPPALETFVLIVMLTLAVLGWALPRLYLRSKATERKHEIERSLPDVLDMLNMCVSQGMTLLKALQRVNVELQNVYPALSQELRIVAEQARIGTLEHALQNLSDRVDVPDVHAFTNLLIQTERMGTSITSALADYAESMRENLRQRADEKANQATFKLLFPTALCLMPAVYMFLLGPSIIELSDFFGGKGGDVLSNATNAVQQLNNDAAPAGNP